MDTEEQGIGYRVRTSKHKVKRDIRKEEEEMKFDEMAENIGLDEQDFREMAELFMKAAQPFQPIERRARAGRGEQAGQPCVALHFVKIIVIGNHDHSAKTTLSWSH